MGARGKSVVGKSDGSEERYSDKLAKLHDAEHLGRFEALLEAAVDLNKIPDEYVICASYDAELGGGGWVRTREVERTFSRPRGLKVKATLGAVFQLVKKGEKVFA